MLRREQFHILSFEGPDAYSRAGGIATRIRSDPERDSELRLSGIRTAREYAWPRVVERALLPRI